MFRGMRCGYAGSMMAYDYLNVSETKREAWLRDVKKEVSCKLIN
jgi:hypothetical protein